MNILKNRRIAYPLTIVLVYGLWLAYMTISNNWHLFQEFWQVSVTMMFGSFVAGATPLGGAVVAFPVFTKVLHIPATDARTFGLFIQSVGMTVAGIFIYSQRIKVLPHVIWWTCLGGFLGLLYGAYFGQFTPPLPRIFFTFAVTAFGFAFILTRWFLDFKPRDDFPVWSNKERGLFFVIGILGGILSANTGAGTDMVAFVVMTLAFGINEKVSIPSTVIMMGIDSLLGFFIYGALIGNVGVVWSYWLVAVPIVILGAPLGAFFASKLKRNHLVSFTLFLIGVELVTTIWLVPFDQRAIVITIGAVILCLISFIAMVRYQHMLSQNHPVKEISTEEAVGVHFL